MWWRCRVGGGDGYYAGFNQTGWHRSETYVVHAPWHLLEPHRRKRAMPDPEQGLRYTTPLYKVQPQLNNEDTWYMWYYLIGNMKKILVFQLMTTFFRQEATKFNLICIWSIFIWPICPSTRIGFPGRYSLGKTGQDFTNQINVSQPLSCCFHVCTFINVFSKCLFKFVTLNEHRYESYIYWPSLKC